MPCYITSYRGKSAYAFVLLASLLLQTPVAMSHSQSMSLTSHDHRHCIHEFYYHLESHIDMVCEFDDDHLERVRFSNTGAPVALTVFHHHYRLDHNSVLDMTPSAHRVFSVTLEPLSIQSIQSPLLVPAHVREFRVTF